MWAQIIDYIAQPAHPLAYRLSSACTQTLAQLCLVNRAFNEITEPLLYLRPYIRRHALDSFCLAVTVYPGEHDKTCEPSAKGKHVQVLITQLGTSCAFVV